MNSEIKEEKVSSYLTSNRWHHLNETIECYTGRTISLVIKDGQSKVTDGGGSVELTRDFIPGIIASFHSDRVVHGTVSDGQSTLPFRLEGMFLCDRSLDEG